MKESLVHGLGLAGARTDLTPWPPGSSPLLRALAGVNLGIESVQVGVAALASLPSWGLQRLVRQVAQRRASLFTTLAALATRSIGLAERLLQSSRARSGFQAGVPVPLGTTIIAMKLVQCWDDGVTTDVRLVSLWRRNGARATVKLNAGLHARERRLGWRHQGTEVWRPGHGELREVYRGFGIANHTLTHPHLEQLPIAAARHAISVGRARPTGAFWCWGHPCELVDEAMGTAFEASRARLCAEPGAQWCDPTALFDGDSP